MIDRKVTLDELNSLITHEKNSRVLKGLYFFKFRYLGDSVEEAAINVGVTKKTGYYWHEVFFCGEGSRQACSSCGRALSGVLAGEASTSNTAVSSGGYDIGEH